ncbi:hypothetical protein C8A00DRAFT_37646 [Chaetomidium leptoderma]|uniref:LysM domain-containing protein n=1 Tax=Chaetomidium leptoderma TaxID=669021 RepID=A0AAN6VER6_9PEZI|nr:hypothetical protein C8A00DRAFT_37646 [Chaetomidium leptoderma]
MSVLSIVLWLCFFQSAAARKERRNGIPKFPFDSTTVDSCAWWLDNDNESSWTCQGIADVFEVSEVDFLRWNPSVASSCNNIPTKQSFCLATSEGWRSSSAGVNSSTGPTPKETVSITVTATVAAVPVTVTVPTTVSLWTTVSLRTTVTVPTTVSVTVPVTVTSTIRTTVTSTVTAAGGPTPSPYQPGMVSNCKAFYFMQWADTCNSIAAKFNIQPSQIVQWNPQAKPDCTLLLAETFCCVKA